MLRPIGYNWSVGKGYLRCQLLVIRATALLSLDTQLMWISWLSSYTKSMKWTAEDREPQLELWERRSVGRINPGRISTHDAMGSILVSARETLSNTSAEHRLCFVTCSKELDTRALLTVLIYLAHVCDQQDTHIIHHRRANNVWGCFIQSFKYQYWSGSGDLIVAYWQQESVFKVQPSQRLI